jgi:hypothetical protein
MFISYTQWRRNRIQAGMFVRKPDRGLRTGLLPDKSGLLRWGWRKSFKIAG